MLPLHDDTPTNSTPVVTVTIIIVCSLVFLYQSSLPPNPGEIFVYQFGAIPAVLFGHAALPPEVAALPAFTTVLTSMFLHGSWMHLFGNMLYLWVFGNNIEDVMGSSKFVVFYLLSGIVAAFSHAFTDTASTVPMVGASGAISGILGAYLLLFPHARILLLAPVVGTTYVPAGIVLGFWFVMQILSGGASLGSQGGGVAFFAHIGGFVAGMVLIGFFKRPEVRFFAPARSSSWRY
jgi:membrane associated rhomboid family serine protease